MSHAAKQVGRFAKTVGGAPRFGFILRLRRGAAHVVGGLAETVQGLLDSRIARALRAAGARFTRLARSRRRGTSLRAAATLLGIVARHLFHLPLEFVGFAAEQL